MGILGFFSLQFKKYYTRLEEFVLKGEQDQGMRLKIKMSLYIAHLLIAYFVLIPFINPYVPLAKMIVSLIGVIGHIFVLRVRNVYLTALYFIFSSIMSQYASTKNHIEFLRVIGVVLIQHNHSLLLSRHKLLNITLGVVTIALVNTTQKRLDELIEDNNLLKIIDAIRNLQYSWPLMFFFNQFSMIHLTEQYCNAIQQSQNTQTELQRKNQELFEVNEKLKKTLSLLEKTNKDLKDAINARELFIASVSHELRNPLNAMVGNIELLGFEVKDPRWLKMLETCKTCGEVLLGLINNVLDVAKINAERLELNCQPGNLYKLIEKVWTVSTIKMRQKGIKGHLLIGNNVPTYIEMDNHRLNQILLNLIGNATKFTSNGFVKVVISWVKDGDITDLTDSEYGFEEIWKSRSRQSMLKAFSSYRNLDVPNLFGVNLPQPESAQDCNEDSILLGSQNTLNRTFDTKFFSYLNFRQYTENDSKIKERTSIRTLQASKERGMLRIEIIDSGCGITEAAIPQLFQAFSQADSSITRHFGGTGLGLYITKQLVQKMEGQIYVKSKKDTGSIFWMGIPARTATKEEEIKEHEIEDFSGLVVSRRNSEVLKALIVDDDPLNQMIMTNYLEKLGMQSEIAGNGQEAIDKFKSREIGYYCLVTMDLQMPVMDGLTASKAIRRYERQIKAHQSVPIIVVTGNCIDMDKSQCMSPVGEIRASYFFRKPFTFEECKSSIKTILQKNWNGDIKQNRRIQVLIADDDSFNTAVLKEYLETSAFECEVCTNGKEAVDLAQAKHFDAILMDCEMPTMDGYTAASQIRAKNKNILIIGVTGNPREDCIQKAREKGMDDVETKPVHFQKLIERLNNILRI